MHTNQHSNNILIEGGRGNDHNYPPWEIILLIVWGEGKLKEIRIQVVYTHNNK